MDYNINKAMKIIVVGESNTGKTSLTCRWTQDRFSENELTTVGIDFSVKVVQVDDVRVRVNFWDTAGQEIFKSITSCFYRGAEGAILVYNVHNKDSFNKIRYWLSEVDACCYQEDIVKVLVANKIDEEGTRKVSREEGQKFAEKYGLVYHEVSAKTSEGTEFALLDMLNKIIKIDKSRESSKQKADVVVIKKQRKWRRIRGASALRKCTIL